MKNIKVIAFDADDTLWQNENFYRDSEKQFCKLMAEYMSEDDVSRELLKTEISNISLYGYGVKSFSLSMIETAIKISDGNVNNKTIQEIIIIGKNLIEMPVILLDGVVAVLSELKESYRIILATKGDLLDQHRKLCKSGLLEFFDHIEIMSEKDVAGYESLIKKLGISVQEFLMVGNTVKSDILPVKMIGAEAVHIPYHITWGHEFSENDEFHFHKLSGIIELPEFLKTKK